MVLNVFHYKIMLSGVYLLTIFSWFSWMKDFRLSKRKTELFAWEKADGNETGGFLSFASKMSLSQVSPIIPRKNVPCQALARAFTESLTRSANRTNQILCFIYDLIFCFFGARETGFFPPSFPDPCVSLLYREKCVSLFRCMREWARIKRPWRALKGSQWQRVHSHQKWHLQQNDSSLYIRENTLGKFIQIKEIPYFCYIF